MFWKLCKMEMKYSWRSFLLLYGILILCSIFIEVGTSTSSTLMNFIQGMMVILFVAAIISIFVLVFINIVRNYIRSMFGRESYLTHTLPVSSTQLLLSKILVGLLWGCLSTFVVIVAAFIFGLRAVGEFTSMADWIYIFQQLNMFRFHTILYVINSILGYAQTMMLIFLVIAFVHTSYVRNYRTPVGIGLYLFINFVQSFIMSLLPGSMNSAGITIGFIFDAGYGVQSNIYLLLAFNMILFLAYFMGTRYLLEYKMEVE